MSLFSAVTGEQVRSAQIVSGVAMALFIGVGLVPGLRRHAGTVRMVVLAGYLLCCAGFVAWVLLQ